LAATAARTFLDRITNPGGQIGDGTFAIEIEVGILNGDTPGFWIILCTRVVRMHVGAAAVRRAVIEVRVAYAL